MKNIFKNWKTTLLGGGALTDGIVRFAQTGDLLSAIPSLIIGLIGLLAKDNNK